MNQHVSDSVFKKQNYELQKDGRREFKHYSVYLKFVALLVIGFWHVISAERDQFHSPKAN